MRRECGKEGWKDRVRRCFAEQRGSFGLLFFLILVPLLSVLRADFLYKDDLGRTLEGYTRWAKSSRYVSDLLAALISFSGHLCDTAPLGQILAAALMAAAGLVLIRIFTENKKKNLFSLLAAALLAVNPYYAECMMFRFDAPLMAASVFFSVVPFLWSGLDFDRRRNMLVYGAASIAGLLLMLTTYQASSGIYPVVTILLAFEQWIRNKRTFLQTVRFALISAVSYGLSLLIFRAGLMHNKGSYYSSEMISLHPGSLPGALWNNFRVMNEQVQDDLNRKWILLLLFCIAGYVICAMLRTARSRLLTLLGTVPVIFACSALSFGIMIMLRTPYTRCRAMYGFFTMPVLMLLITVGEKKSWYAKIVCAGLFWAFMTFTFILGNCLGRQEEFMATRFQAVAEDINDLDMVDGEDTTYLQFKGYVGFAPPVKRTILQYPVVERLLPTSRAGYQWNRYYFVGYYGWKNLKYVRKYDMSELSLPLVKKTSWYTLYADDTHILADFNKS